MSENEKPKPPLRFPQARTRPPQSAYAKLGFGALGQQIGLPDRQATGHWCSRCRGIWFGYPLEAACPVCGNRHG